MANRILVMNMGSTSTKLAVYEDEINIWTKNITHDKSAFKNFTHYTLQYDYRKAVVLEYLKSKNENLENFTAFVSRGGTIRPVSGGVFYISEQMIEDGLSGKYGDHPCNLSMKLAFELAVQYRAVALTVDPPVCDELCTEATYSGLPEIERMAVFHALNQRAIARRYCDEHNKNYTNLNLIVAHIGGGISVGAHQRGKIIDVNNALAGDGPFGLERSGSLPVGELIKLCYSGKYTKEEMLQRVNGKGGVSAYLDESDGKVLEHKILLGDEYTLEVVSAMAYQVAKEIGAIASVLNGEVDAILLTGGLAYWDRFTNMITKKIGFIADIYIYPGEDEMLSLANGAYRHINGIELAKNY